VAVDVATTWTALQAVCGLHHRRVTSGIHLLRQRLPVPLRAWPSDNGGEFPNARLVAWCRREGIRFTRSRPYRKNDQTWVEQRNGLLVRRLVGYDRYSSRAAFAVLQRLYHLLRLQHNFFRPVRTPRSKRRLGRTVTKRYDAPRTPYQRMLLSGVLTEAQRQALDPQCLALDPIVLARDIQLTLTCCGNWPTLAPSVGRPPVRNTFVRHHPRRSVTPTGQVPPRPGHVTDRPYF